MTGKKILSICLALTVSLGIVWGCDPFKMYVDVSDDPIFRNFIGATYQTIEDLEILGITMDRDYAPRVDRFVITSAPSFGGPEVVSRDRLQQGTLLRVSKVLECSNCVLDDGFTVEVDVLEGDGYGRAPVELWSVPEVLPVNSREHGIELSTALFRTTDIPSGVVD